MSGHAFASDRLDTDAPPDFGMTDLEDTLRGPGGAEAKRSAVARIDASLSRIQDHLQAGIDPRQMETIKSMQRSLVVARLIVINAPLTENPRRES